jgi:hypothetical protein
MIRMAAEKARLGEKEETRRIKNEIARNAVDLTGPLAGSLLVTGFGVSEVEPKDF